MQPEKMLELKWDRLNRLISSMEDILKGDNKMDFAVFDQKEIEEMYREQLITRMAASQVQEKGGFDDRYGDGSTEFIAKAIMKFYGHRSVQIQS